MPGFRVLAFYVSGSFEPGMLGRYVLHSKELNGQCGTLEETESPARCAFVTKI
jgi:hypothetical protein